MYCNILRFVGHFLPLMRVTTVLPTYYVADSFQSFQDTHTLKDPLYSAACSAYLTSDELGRPNW